MGMRALWPSLLRVDRDFAIAPASCLNRVQELVTDRALTAFGVGFEEGAR
jgi:hypothetical protein